MDNETKGICETVPRPQVVFHVQHIRNGEVIDEFDVDATRVHEAILGVEELRDAVMAGGEQMAFHPTRPNEKALSQICVGPL